MSWQKKNGSPWQLKQVIETRDKVNKHLDLALEHGIAGRLTTALAAISNSSQLFTPEVQLERFIYIIAALGHHARWGGLSDRDAVQLINIAESTLLSHRVERTSSTLSELWGELHVARSQILRVAGKSWESMWEHQLGHQSSRRAPVGSIAFHSLAAGLRALRLGMLDIAAKALANAEEGDLPKRNQEQARIGRVQATRLAGNFDGARNLLEKILSDASISTLTRRDCQWEVLVLNSVVTGNIEKLIHSTKTEHQYPTFVLEAFLWSRSVQSRQFEISFPNIRSLRRKCGDLLTKAKAFRLCFDACSQIDDAYDADRPLHVRTRSLGESLQQSPALPSLDKELLFRVAAFRWLYRAKQLEFAAFVFADYEMRCQQLSMGASGDVMGLVKDVDRQSLLIHYVAPPIRSVS